MQQEIHWARTDESYWSELFSENMGFFYSILNFHHTGQKCGLVKSEGTCRRRFQLFTKRQIFRLVQMDSIKFCIRQYKCDWKVEICCGTGWRHCRKRRKCWIPAICPFPSMFSKGFFFKVRIVWWNCCSNSGIGLWFENIMGKGENAGYQHCYQHFLLFRHCFQKTSP